MKNLTKSTNLLRMLFMTFFMLATVSIYASHFRYMTVNYEIVSTGPGGTVVEFNVIQSWRSSFFYGSVPGSQSGPVTALGQLKWTGNFQFGDGSQIPLIISVNNINTAEDFFVGNATFTHTYQGSSDVVARFFNCCRISGLGPNSNVNYDMRTVVTLSDLTNTSPVANTPPILFVPINQVNNIQISAFDPNGDTLSYTFTTSSESGLIEPVPITPNGPATLNSSGLLTIDTNGVPIDTKFATQVKIIDSRGASIPLDFIIQTIGSSTPPQFLYPPTPASGTVINVGQGNTASFNLEATDADPGDTVSIFATGLPTGASFTANPGNPADANFSWTPTGTDLGAYVIAFTAQDDVFAQANTSVTINVVPCSIDATAVATDVSCPGESDGAIDLSLVGNFGNPNYDWTGPNGFTASTEDINGLSEGTYSVTATGDFGLGCSVNRSYTIGLTPDVILPTVITQNITVELNTLGNASITPAMVDNGSFDNCAIDSYSLDISNFTTSDLGQNTVTLTVTDSSGNSDFATAIVTVEENDGTPNTLAFQEVFSNRGLASGSVAFADVDGDNDQDVVLTGALNVSATGIAGPLFSDLFKNDGNGTFTQVLGGAPFMGLAYSSASFIDLNNDSVLDFISTGEDLATGDDFDNFYMNDGTGVFTQFGGFAFTVLERRDFKFADLDGDNLDDLLIIGEDTNGIPRVKLFQSLGSSYSPLSVSLPAVLFGSIAVGDVNGDNINDIFISGQLANGSKIARIYTNDGNFQFSLLQATSFEGLYKGDSSFADVDNDGDQDLLISGQNSNMDNVLKLYLNDGSGVFTEAAGIINLPSNIFMQAFEFADIDGDSDFDILMTGYNTSNFRTLTKIWENLLISPVALKSGGDSSSNYAVNFTENNTEFGFGFRLFPNPTDRGYFNIATPNLEGKVSIQISDMQGRTVLSQYKVVESNNVQVYTEDISSGIYMVTLKHGNQSYITKVIVK